MINQLTKKKFFSALKSIQYGQMTIVEPNGKQHIFKGLNNGRQVNIKLTSWRVIRNLFLKGDVGFAQDYRDGLWSTDNLTELLQFSIKNKQALAKCFDANFLMSIILKTIQYFQKNTIKQSRKNIAHHYDLGNNFYQLWLDETMTYSSALFPDNVDCLKSAQKNKYQVILDRLKPSGSLLEIGCGWGGFAEQAYSSGDYKINCLTLSQEQKQYSEQRLQNKANILLQDYRDHQGQYDHIVSIEMFEAVGKEYWQTYFNKIKSLLKQGGSAVIQTITIRDDLYSSYEKSTDMLRTFIFPGGLLPSIEELQPIIKKAGLEFTVLRRFGLDYAKTLEIWAKNISLVKNKLPKLGYDDRFQRLWAFYLSACIAGFTEKQTDVCQLELRHSET